MFNLSLSQGVFPDELKIAKVLPLFKSGDQTIFTNYRPISILPFLSKILEKLMYCRLINFIEKYNLLYCLQFGFRKHYSTGLALTYLVDKISESMDTGRFSIGIFLDFSKAFDTVDHNILFAKLSCYGIRGLALNWIVSYLSNRRQYVSFDGINSTVSNISIGVPQGSVLGPLLFLLYINDLSNVSRLLNIILFADDSSALYSGTNLNQMQNIINSELQKIVDWLECNRLSLNIAKSHFIIFSKREVYNPITLFMKENILTQVTHTKFLGVVVDQSLSWKEHIIYIKGKIARGVGIIRKCKKIFNQNTLLNLYYSFVYPHLYYNVETWGSTCKTYLHCLSKLQKSCVRLLTLKFNESSFKSLNVLNVNQLYKSKVSFFLYKYMNNRLPRIFENFYFMNNYHHNYQTRYSNLLRVPLSSTELRKRTIRFTGVTIYNELYSNVKFNVSFGTFKSTSKLYFLNS